MLILAPLETREGLGAFLPLLEDALVGKRWLLGRAARLQQPRVWPVVAAAPGVGVIAGTRALAMPERKTVHHRVRREIRHQQTKFQVTRTETMPCATDGWQPPLSQPRPCY